MSRFALTALTFLANLIGILGFHHADAADPLDEPAPWSQFRGPSGQGLVDGAIPIAWGEGKNVAWKTPLAGKGWSSPVTASGRAWVTTAIHRQGAVEEQLAEGGLRDRAR